MNNIFPYQKIGSFFLAFLAKQMQHVFYAHLSSCLYLIYTGEECKTLQSILKQCVFGLLIIVLIVLKTLCCL